MPGDDRGSAAARRDDGLRRISRFTWRAGAAGVIGSALIAIAFGHHASAASQGSSGSSGASGGIVVPGAPPAPAAGSGHVVSGAS